MSDQIRYAQVERDEEGRANLRYERLLKHPVARVWDAVSNPEKLALWLAEFNMELKIGAPVHVQFTNNCTVENGQLVPKKEGDTSKGQITALIPNELLEYTWQWKDEPVSVVRWELRPAGDDHCLLILTHHLLSEGFASVSAGWHTHLDMLEHVLDGKADHFEWREDLWRPKFEDYKERLKGMFY